MTPSEKIKLMEIAADITRAEIGSLRNKEDIKRSYEYLLSVITQETPNKG